MRKVFISYARQDNAAAEQLVNALRNVDIAGWLDAADIASGEGIASAVRTALRGADAVVVLVSPGALHRQWLQFEVGAAEALQKPIIPVLVSGADLGDWLPDILQSRQWIDARDRLPADVAEQIERALNRDSISTVAESAAGPDPETMRFGPPLPATDPYRAEKTMTDDPYPSPETLRRFDSYPFGKLIADLIERDEHGFAEHNEQVCHATVELLQVSTGRALIQEDHLGQTVYEACLRLVSEEGRNLPRGFEILHTSDRTLADRLQRALEERRTPLLGLQEREELVYAAIHHDIGKSVAYEKHPVIGWHIVTDLHSSSKDQLIKKWGRQRFRTWQLLIRDHDKFGVLSTGEASLPILLSVARYATANLEETRRRLAMLMVLNLADIAGSRGARPPERASAPYLTGRKVELVCRDWFEFDSQLKEAGGLRERLTSQVVRLAQETDKNVGRIHRLLIEASHQPKGGEVASWLDEFRGDLEDTTLVEEALEDACGVGVSEFCETFGLVSKLDYSLAFFGRMLELAAQNQKKSEQVVSVVIAVLKRVCDTFSGLVGSEHSASAIGVGFETLRPRRFRTVENGKTVFKEEEEVKAKRDQIITILFDRQDRGLRWLIDEIAGWQMVT